MTDEINTMRSPRAIVRYGYRETDTWRTACGNAALLLALCAYGPLDAPENMPAGSMRAFGLGCPSATTWSRT